MAPEFDKYESVFSGTKHEKRFKEFRRDLTKLKVNIPSLKNYPGSEKGVTPDEDKEFARHWFNENLPQNMKSFQEKYFGQNQGKTPRAAETSAKDSYVQDVDMFHYIHNYDNEFPLDKCDDMPLWSMLRDENIGTHYLSPNVVNHTYGNQPHNVDDFYDANESDEEISRHFNTEYTCELEEVLYPREDKKQVAMANIPVFPPNPDFRYEYMIRVVNDYASFRQFIMIHNYMRTKQLPSFGKGTFSAQKWYAHEEPVPLPSLFAYYETLPEKVREHPSVKQLVLALEVS
jgi:hypothetical protein